MSTREMITAIAALIGALTLVGCASPPPPTATPLNERYRTPNVERLAAQGMTFTQAYASAPVCTPTRTSLMTGRSPARNHITYWTLNADSDTSAHFPGLLPPAWRAGMAAVAI